MNSYTECCRLCLSYKQDQLKPVFMNPQRDKTLREKILMFSSIDIKINDRLSVMICQQCLQKISDWCEFKMICKNNQTILEDLANAKQDLHNMSIEIKEEVTGHNMHAEDVNIITSNSDSDIDLDSFDEQTSQFFNASPFKYQVCDIEFEDKELCNDHEEMEHGIESEVTTEGIESNIREATTKHLSENEEFTTDLSLMKRNSAPITIENLSLIELSYIQKCKAMVKMYQTLICTCHNMSHPNLSRLISHQRAFGNEIPVFTCYHCMITFMDRKSSGKHNRKCTKKDFETLVKLSNLTKRSGIKTRLYQNYKCVECQLIFSFHDDLRKHIDEQHSKSKSSFLCSCQESFESAEHYNEHRYVSCLLEYYCDICYVSVKTLKDFIQHAAENHDNSDGSILQDDNHSRRCFTEVEPTKYRDILRKKRISTSGSTPPALKPKAMDSEMEKNSDYNVSMGSRNSEMKCPECSKVYSRQDSMLRHFRTHSGNKDKIQSNDNLRSHSSSCRCQEHQNLYNSKSNKDSNEQKKCLNCNKIYLFQKVLEDQCETDPTLAKYSGLRDHNIMKHSDNLAMNRTYPSLCDEYDKVITTGSAFANNKKTHRRDKEATAKLYAKTDSPDETPTLTRARRSRTQPVTSKKFACKFCKKLFTSKNALHGHLKCHKSAKPKALLNATNIRKSLCILPKLKGSEFLCPTCKIELPNEAALKIHNIEKHGNNVSPLMLRCESCNTEFITLTDYENHKKVHEIVENQKKIVRYSCKYCLDSFIKNKTLQSHIRLNHAKLSQEFKCSHCCRVFDKKVSLRNHVKVHKKQIAVVGSHKPSYICSICYMCFHIPKDLITHTKTAHPFWNKKEE